MKHILLCMVFIVPLLSNCSNKKKVGITGSTTPIQISPDWLVGDWIRIDEKEGRKTYESWERINANLYKAIGCTIAGIDTVWQERILLRKNSDKWTFEVQGKTGSIFTIFIVTKMEKSSFKSENAENDFPKKIEYAFDGIHLNAIISGGGPDISFNFEKLY